MLGLFSAKKAREITNGNIKDFKKKLSKMIKLSAQNGFEDIKIYSSDGADKKAIYDYYSGVGKKELEDIGYTIKTYFEEDEDLKYLKISW